MSYLTSSAYGHLGHSHLLERSHRFLCATLLDVSHGRVEDHDREDRYGLNPVTEKERDERRCKEHIGEDGPELSKKYLETSPYGSILDLVRANLSESGRRL